MIIRGEAQALLDHAELIYSEQDVQEALGQVAGRIGECVKEMNPLVLCVMKGGFFYCGQLLSRFAFPLELDYLHVARYDAQGTGRRLAWRTAPWISVKGRNVLVVDDIVDAGITLYEIKERLLKMGAKQVITTAFLDKETGKNKPIQADFVGLSVPDRFVFGFGMDIQNAWRHLPAIYAAP